VILSNNQTIVRYGIYHVWLAYGVIGKHGHVQSSGLSEYSHESKVITSTDVLMANLDAFDPILKCLLTGVCCVLCVCVCVCDPYGDIVT